MAVAPLLHCARCWHTGLWPHPGSEGVCFWWTHVGPPQHKSDSAGADSVQSTTTDTQTDMNINVVTVLSSHKGQLQWTMILLTYSPTAYLCSAICGCLYNWLCFRNAIIVVLTKSHLTRTTTVSVSVPAFFYVTQKLTFAAVNWSGKLRLSYSWVAPIWFLKDWIDIVLSQAFPW